MNSNVMISFNGLSHECRQAITWAKYITLSAMGKHTEIWIQLYCLFLFVQNEFGIQFSIMWRIVPVY